MFKALEDMKTKQELDTMAHNKWKWDSTELKYLDTSLSMDDLEQLCSTRGSSIHCGNYCKIPLVLMITAKLDVDLPIPFENLTNKQLQAELKLRGLNHKKANKSVLLSRLTQYIPTPNARQWLLQPPVPLEGYTSNCYDFTALNAKEFCGSFVGGLYKYNIFTKKWTKWLLPIPDTASNTRICFDTNHKNIFAHYSVDRQRSLLLINVESKQSEKINNKLFEAADFRMVQMTFMQDEVHIICARIPPGQQRHVCEQWHVILDANNPSKCTSHRLNANEMTNIVAIPSRQIMLGFDGKTIHMYSKATRKWSVCSQFKQYTDAFYTRRNCEMVVTMDERYVILFSRLAEGVETYVIDVNTMTMHNMINSGKCPFTTNRFHAVITNDTLQRPLIVFGYVRKCWTTDTLASLQMPPDYIIKLIVSWYCLETVHLLNRNCKKHFIMYVDEIVKNIVLK